MKQNIVNGADSFKTPAKMAHVCLRRWQGFDLI
jgi:hypothetical protein